MQLGMSDLVPTCPTVQPLTARQCRDAAISVCQFVEYDAGALILHLRQLGLARSTATGLIPAQEPDALDWRA